MRGKRVCAPQQKLLVAHATAPGRRVRAFLSFFLLNPFRFMYSSACLPGPGCPAFSIRSRDCTTPPGTANQDVSIILLCRADLAFLREGGGLDEWVWMLRVTCRVMYSKWLV